MRCVCLSLLSASETLTHNYVIVHYGDFIASSKTTDHHVLLEPEHHITHIISLTWHGILIFSFFLSLLSAFYDAKQAKMETGFYNKKNYDIKEIKSWNDRKKFFFYVFVHEFWKLSRRIYGKT